MEESIELEAESDPFATSEESLLSVETDEGLWEEETPLESPEVEESIELEAESDPFVMTEDEDFFGGGSSEAESLDIPQASEEEEAEILSAFETETMSETIWDDSASFDEISGNREESDGENLMGFEEDEDNDRDLVEIFDGDESEVQVSSEVPGSYAGVVGNAEKIDELETELLDVFGDTEELDFPEMRQEVSDFGNPIDTAVMESLQADMLQEDLWNESPVSHTAPTIVEPDLEEMIDEFPQEGLDSLEESTEDSVLSGSEGLDDLLSEDWEEEERAIAPDIMAEELVLEGEDEIDPLADLFNDEETDPFAMDSSKSLKEEDSGIFDALGEDPFGELEDPFAQE